MIENEELQQRIAAYIDGKLTPAEAARLEVYLANTDPGLADAIVGMLADKIQVRAMPRPRPPMDLSARIMEQIERTSLLNDHEPVGQRPWWQSRTAIAAGLAVVLGGFSYFVITSVRRPTTPTSIAAGTTSNAIGTPKESSATGDVSGAGVSIAGVTPGREGAGATPASPGRLANSGGSTAASPTVGPALAMAQPKDAANAPAIAAPGGPVMPAAPTAAPMAATAPAVATASPAPASAPVNSAPASAVQVASGSTTQAHADVNSGPMIAQGPAVGTPDIASGAPVGGGGFVGGGGAGIGRGGAGGGRGGRGGGAGAAGAGGGVGGGGFGAGGGGAGGATAARGGGAGVGGVGGRGPGPGAMATIAVDGMQSLAPTADNTLKALAVVSHDLSGPMIVTLLAKDDQDYNRLAASLTTYATANMPLRVSNVLTQAQPPLANAVPADDPRTGVRQGQNTLGNQEPQVQNRNNEFRQNEAGTVAVNITGGGVIVFDAPASAGQVRTSVQNGTLQLSINDNLTSNSGNTTNGRGNLVYNNDPSLKVDGGAKFTGGNYDNGGNDKDRAAQVMSNVQTAASHGGPYHLALRQDQIEELAKNYRVGLVARGNTVYEFHLTGDKQTSTADASRRADLLKKAEMDANATPVVVAAATAPMTGGTLNLSGGNGTALPAATGTNTYSGAGTVGTGALSNSANGATTVNGGTLTVGGANNFTGGTTVSGGVIVNGNSMNTVGLEGSGNSTFVSGLVNSQSGLMKNGAGTLTLTPLPLLDCIITMEPPPAPGSGK